MRIRIDLIDIKQENLSQWKQLFKRVPRDAAAGIDRGGNVLRAQFFGKRGAEIGLQQGLAAGKRDAAARLLIETRSSSAMAAASSTVIEHPNNWSASPRQPGTHRPQARQRARSNRCRPSVIECAPWGQTASHSPQEMQLCA